MRRLMKMIAALIAATLFLSVAAVAGAETEEPPTRDDAVVDQDRVQDRDQLHEEAVLDQDRDRLHEEAVLDQDRDRLRDEAVLDQDRDRDRDRLHEEEAPDQTRERERDGVRDECHDRTRDGATDSCPFDGIDLDDPTVVRQLVHRLIAAGEWQKLFRLLHAIGAF